MEKSRPFWRQCKKSRRCMKVTVYAGTFCRQLAKSLVLRPELGWTDVFYHNTTSTRLKSLGKVVIYHHGIPTGLRRYVLFLGRCNAFYTYFQGK
ncbi:MAG: hypothetical protein ACRC10_01110 [Thermoguttaceae bacterium]